jgi:hypothetical protein
MEKPIPVMEARESPSTNSGNPRVRRDTSNRRAPTAVEARATRATARKPSVSMQISSQPTSTVHVLT